MKIIRFADLKPRPWKNGGGTTTEIAVSPEGAGFDDFDWRISVADVASDGPFSTFPGIDRILTVIAGSGLTMTIEGQPSLQLDASSPPLSFPGDLPVTASLVDGPIRDCNVMTRRGRCVATVSRADASSGPVDLPAGKRCFLFVLEAGTVILADRSIEVRFGDLIETDATDSAISSGSAPVLLIEFSPTSD